MGELKNKGREGVKENQDKFQEIQEGAEQSLEERNRNIEIVHSLEGVDDDDKASIEDSKEQGKEIADQIAESQMEAPKNEVNSRMENTVNEMKDLEGQEKDDVSKANAMDGNYGGVGAGLESKFEDSANEFNDIATSGEEIQEQSNAQIDNIIQNMKEDW
ncbi:hypothetical protein [Blautia obeum]|uniref:Uncharacterized protein n=1 Tax=Blautia obeum TaxID=40520 RepID=A0A411ZR21_9FIRM|nr:hypothetical protein [Blautia obeum]RGQ05271.1 hypothetical protein DWZ12_08025 [Blautia obeum]